MKKNYPVKWISIPFLLSLLTVSACISPVKFMDRETRIPERIAVLPTINHTTDVNGGIVFRNLLFQAMQEEEYTFMVDLDSVDKLLNMEGITDGGQLSLLDNSELFDILHVDGLLFIDLQECEYTTLGISETRRIKVELFLYKSPSRMVWQYDRDLDEGKSIFDTLFDFLDDPDKALEETAGDFAAQVGEKGVRMWLLEHELKPEMETIIDEVLDTLP